MMLVTNPDILKPAPEITDFKLALSAVLVVGAGLLSAIAGLGLLKSLLIGIVRTVVQLLIMGYILIIVFGWKEPYAVFGVVIVMCLVATREALQRARGAYKVSRIMTFSTLAATTFSVSLIVCAVVIQEKPFWRPAVALPLVGMILGHALNSTSLALERFNSEVRSSRERIEVLLSLGASPFEAVKEQLRNAVRAGMTPLINALNIVGLVSLPGVMTGQILAGVPPLSAAKYQIVIMLMLALSSSFSCLLSVWLQHKRFFNKDQALI